LTHTPSARDRLIEDIALAVLAAAFTVGVCLMSRHASYYDIYRLSGQDPVSFERAAVLSVDREQIEEQKSQRGMFTGYQDLTIRLLSGTRAGEQHTITNYLNYDMSFKFKKGDRLIVSVNSTASGKTLQIYVSTPERLPWLGGLLGLAALMLIITGGRQGFRSLLGLVFTADCILFVFVPLVYRGIEPAPAALILAVVVSCTVLPLSCGWGKKTAAAILSTLGCVCLSMAVQLLFCHFAFLSGFTLGDTDSLMKIAAHSGLKIGGLLFSAILISSLGAVMDIAMSIASAINELSLADGAASFGRLFSAGMTIGRDMSGTMANTLILAFAGSSLIPLIQIYTYNMQLNQVLNSNDIAVEVTQSLAGSLAVIAAVPLVSAVSALLLSKKS